MKTQKKAIPRINLGFDQYTDAGLADKAGSIYEGMNENINFPTPKPTMPTFLANRTAFVNALDRASSRSKNDVAVKNQARLLLTDNLIELGNYVTLEAKGNLVLLTESRFDQRKRRESKPEVQQPKNLVLADGVNIGMLMMTIDAAKGARSYSFEITPDPVTPNSVWTKISSTTRKCTFPNLESGKKMWGRVGVVGVKNQFVYSVVLSWTVQ